MQGKRVLELGCGCGLVGLCFAACGALVPHLSGQSSAHDSFAAVPKQHHNLTSDSHVAQLRQAMQPALLLSSRQPLQSILTIPEHEFVMWWNQWELLVHWLAGADPAEHKSQ